MENKEKLLEILNKNINRLEEHSKELLIFEKDSLNFRILLRYTIDTIPEVREDVKIFGVKLYEKIVTPQIFNWVTHLECYGKDVEEIYSLDKSVFIDMFARFKKNKKDKLTKEIHKEYGSRQREL